MTNFASPLRYSEKERFLFRTKRFINIQGKEEVKMYKNEPM